MSHGDKYTGREIEQAAKKNSCAQGDFRRDSKLGIRNSDNVGRRTLSRPACRVFPASLAPQAELTLEFTRCYGG